MLFNDQFAKPFFRIAQALKVSQHGKDPLTHIVEIVREHFHAKSCSLYEYRKGGLILVATDKDDPSIRTIEANTLQELMDLVVRKQEAVFTRATHVGERSYSIAAVPLVYQEKVVGVLTLQTNQPHGFNPSENQFLEFIALQVASVIQSLIIARRAEKQFKKGQHTIVIKGIGVSSGFGIGPALFLHPGITTLGFSKTDLSSNSIRVEGNKLQAALKRTSDDLNHLEDRVEENFSEDESAIFYSHRIILLDPVFLKKLDDEINSGKGALEAVGDVLQEYITQFGEIKNSRFCETAIDLEELRQRILEHLLGMESRQEKEDWSGILVAKSLGPSDTMRLDASKLLGIITMAGGPTSHAAILARSLGIPAVMGAVGIMEKIKPGDLLIVDGDKGKIIGHPEPSILHDYELLEKERLKEIVSLNAVAYEPAATLDGHSIHLEANASFTSDLSKLRSFGAGGVGLFRTEFLFLKKRRLLSESEQFDSYRQMIADAGGLPITFRIMDAGGDKIVESLQMEKEENPFLGYRSIRLTLSQPEILKTQLRALLRASAFGSIRLLIPMISGMEEVDAIKKILEAVKKELSRKKISFDSQIPFGVMIEVPSAVPIAHLIIEHADFLSIGTNDLTQYTLAVDRNNERVARFFEPLHPAMLSFISQVASVGSKAGKPVGICGEMASEPFIIPLLVGLGITNLSMIPAGILAAKKVIRELNYQEAREMAKQALQSSRIQEVKDILTRFHKRPLERNWIPKLFKT